MSTNYDKKSGLWVSTDGSEVCQDHAHPMPCPHQHRGNTAPTRY